MACFPLNTANAAISSAVFAELENVESQINARRVGAKLDVL